MQSMLLCRLLFDRMKLLPIYLAASSVLRAGSQVFAHKSRVFATGLPTTAPVRQPAAAAPKASITPFHRSYLRL